MNMNIWILALTIVIGCICYVLLKGQDSPLFIFAIWSVIIVELFILFRRLVCTEHNKSAVAIISLFLLWICFLITILYYHERSDNKSYAYFAELISKHISTGRSSKSYVFTYNLRSADTSFIENVIVESERYNKSDDYKYVLIDNTFWSKMIGKNLSENDTALYKNPILFKNKFDIELGNDSYEYAKFAPYNVYHNFGLSLVFVGWKSNTACVEIIFFDGGTKFINLSLEKESVKQDTFLVYSNINPNFSDGWHICSDSLCTPENIAKVDSAGYGYLFRGKIYSAAETEKYWNIIEQYKLRNH